MICAHVYAVVSFRAQNWEEIGDTEDISEIMAMSDDEGDSGPDDSDDEGARGSSNLRKLLLGRCGEVRLQA